MRRCQLFEFCDMPWFKGILREGLMDCLNNFHRVLKPYQYIAPVLYDWAQRNHVDMLLDIGSGGGEHIATLLEEQPTSPLPKLRFVLSDLYPQVGSYEQLKAEHGADVIDYIAHPVAVTEIPQKYRFLSIFSAFHHFDPKAASDLLNNIATNQNGICIIEFTERNWINLCAIIPAFLFNMIAPFTASRFRLSKVLFGTLLPVIPLLVCFDGMISVLRSYKVDELYSLLPAEARDDFVVEHGSVRWGFLPLVRANYFFLLRRGSLA